MAGEFEKLCTRFEQLDQGRSIPLIGDGSPSAGLIGAGAWIGLNSSGTTGFPHPVWLSWGAFKGSIKVSSSRKGWVWATGFLPGSYAGAQVAAQAWLEGGKVLFLNTVGRETWNVLEQESVAALSATPTFVDLLLASKGPEDRWCPRTLILGGEVLRPQVGERLRGRFPGTRIHLVYASSELGVILRTRRLDGLFELTGLDARFQGWRLTENGPTTGGRIGHLELLLHDEWRSTGDVAESVFEPSGHACLRLVGRYDAVANVGGKKVNLGAVTSVAESVPGVVRAVAWSEPNAVVGEIVGLRVELKPGLDWAEVKSSVEQRFWENFPKPGWPRVWEVGAIGLGANGKREERHKQWKRGE